jgi:hypothetical protein
VRTALPFELDGGYPGGLDLSQPERFAVTTAPLGAARLVIEVATYGGEPQPPLVGSRVLPSGGIGVSLGRSKPRFVCPCRASIRPLLVASGACGHRVAWWCCS